MAQQPQRQNRDKERQRERESKIEGSGKSINDTALFPQLGTTFALFPVSAFDHIFLSLSLSPLSPFPTVCQIALATGLTGHTSHRSVLLLAGI